jgi:hypothetical protein
MENDNNIMLDILVFSPDNIIVYRYVVMEKENNILLDILMFLLTISYCTGMY